LPDMELVRKSIDTFQYHFVLDALESADESTEPSVRCRSYLLAGKARSDRCEFEAAAGWYHKAANDTACPIRDYATYFEALCLFRAEQWDTVQDRCSGILSNYPGFTFRKETILLASDTFERQKKWQDILDLLKHEPVSEDILYRRTRAHWELSRFDEAYKLLQKLWILYPGGRHARDVEQRFKDVSSRLNREFPGVSDRQMMDRARAMDKAGLKQAAAELYKDLLSLDLPADQDALCRVFLAKIYSDIRKNSDALKLYDQFLLKYPDHSSVPTVLMRKGIIFRRRGDDRAYLDSARTVIDRHAWSYRWADTLIGRGEFYRGKGKLTQAAGDFDRVIKNGGAAVDTARWKKAWVLFDQKNYTAAEMMFRWFANHRKNSAWEPQGLYWAARCQEFRGESGETAKIYRDIIDRFGWTYSGYRAAERLKIPLPAFESADLKENSANRKKILSGKSQKTAARATCLMQTGHYEYAAQEWDRLRRKKIPVEMVIRGARCHVLAGNPVAARRRLVNHFADHLAGGDVPNDVIRMLYPYPEAVKRLIQRWADHYPVDPFLVASVILQESGFDPAALSDNMAAGYMQLMPGLFMRMAAEWDVPVNANDRFIPENNIRCGIQYLNVLLARYNNCIPKALAAYNAGEHRVDLWQKQYPDLAEDVWVEHIPFQQTRLFVKKILSNLTCYERIYGISAD
jgi:peptidoglycan lytic transglycosylase